MRNLPYRWWVLATLVVLLLLVMVCLIHEQPLASRGAVISFMGYTNLPNNARRFALLCLSNQDPVTLRWRDQWVEVQGLRDYKAPTINRSLPWFKGATLKKGESLTIAVGDPQEEAQWRFTTICSPYTFHFRLLDFAYQHRLRLRLRQFKLLDEQEILSLTNSITNSSVWLGK